MDDPENSITRESVDAFAKVIGLGRTVTSVVRNTTVGIATITLDRRHGLSGIVTYSSLTGASGFTPGTYYNVKLLNDGTTNWDGATAKVTVNPSGSVASVDIIDGGSGYLNGEILDLDGFTGADITISSAGISTVINNSLQFTGIGSTSDGIYRVVNVPSATSIAVAITAGDPEISRNQIMVNCGRSIGISTIVSFAGISTITTRDAHGPHFWIKF